MAITRKQQKYHPIEAYFRIQRIQNVQYANLLANRDTPKYHTAGVISDAASLTDVGTYSKGRLSRIQRVKF